MSSARWSKVAPTLSLASDDERVRSRDRACLVSGLAVGAGLGALAGAFARPNGAFLTVAGAVAGAIVGKLVALQISADDWDPHWSRRSYVGASSPDDDFASG
jgi:hypothetical protein